MDYILLEKGPNAINNDWDKQLVFCLRISTLFFKEASFLFTFPVFIGSEQIRKVNEQAIRSVISPK